MLAQTPNGNLAAPKRFAGQTGNWHGYRRWLLTSTSTATATSWSAACSSRRAAASLPSRLIPGLPVYELDVADINRDGRPDLVVNTMFTAGPRTMRER